MEMLTQSAMHRADVVHHSINLFLPHSINNHYSSPHTDLGLITAPADQYVVAGQDAVFECLFHDPDNLYGPSISTIRQGSQIVNVISGASVEDEGEYECDIILLEESASTLVPIRLHVFSEWTHT